MMFRIVECLIWFLLWHCVICVNISESTSCSMNNRYVVAMDNSHTKSMATPAKFRSLMKYDVTMWYDDGDAGAYLGELKYRQEMTVATYEGHEFFFKKKHSRRGWQGRLREVARVIIDARKVLYVLREEGAITPPDVEMSSAARATAKEEAFMTQYYSSTGRHWLHYFKDAPRPPPVLPMRSAPFVGHRDTVSSSQFYWICADSSPRRSCRSISPSSFDMPLDESKSTDGSFERSVQLQVESISLAPRAFMVEDFLSPFEADELVRLAAPHITKSFVGQADSGGVVSSDTRTSSNTWIARESSAIVDTLYRRIGEVAGIDERLLTASENAERMQVVHYEEGEAYSAHHDWAVRGYEESRFLTVLLYLSDPSSPSAGGETAFPKGGADGMGFQIVPKKGNAVFFYNLLEDGNGDDLSLHSARPVKEGEKWLANVWIWDPKICDTVRFPRSTNN